MSASPESLSRIRLKAAAIALRAYPCIDLLADCKAGETTDDDVLAGRRRELVAQLLHGLALELRIVHLLLEHRHRPKPRVELARDDALAHVLRLVGRFLFIDSGLGVAHILAADIPEGGRGGDLHCHVAREGNEVLVLGDEVGVAVNLHEYPHLGAGVYVGLHRPLGGRALAEILNLLALLYAQDLDRLLDVAAGLGKRLLAVHHPSSRALAQGLYVLGSDHHLAHDSPPSSPAAAAISSASALDSASGGVGSPSPPALPSAPPWSGSDAGSGAAASSDAGSATSAAAPAPAGGSGSGAAASGPSTLRGGGAGPRCACTGAASAPAGTSLPALASAAAAASAAACSSAWRRACSSASRLARSSSSMRAFSSASRRARSSSARNTEWPSATTCPIACVIRAQERIASSLPGTT